MMQAAATHARGEAEGHAVRALYAASGATDYFAESGDPAYKRTLDLLWSDLTQRKMYITGGVGSRSGGESFGDPYELPSEQAYAETCAAIANVMWNYRMLALTGDGRYADVLRNGTFIAYIFVNVIFIGAGIAVMSELLPPFAKSTAHVSDHRAWHPSVLVPS